MNIKTPAPLLVRGLLRQSAKIFGAPTPPLVLLGLGPRTQRAVRSTVSIEPDRAMFTYWVYILASRPHGTLYMGVTNTLLARIAAHREGSGTTFTRRFGVTKLVHDESFADIDEAMQRENALKHWVRQWQIIPIERDNPQRIDHYPALLALPGHSAR